MGDSAFDEEFHSWVDDEERKDDAVVDEGDSAVVVDGVAVGVVVGAVGDDDGAYVRRVVRDGDGRACSNGCPSVDPHFDDEDDEADDVDDDLFLVQQNPKAKVILVIGSRKRKVMKRIQKIFIRNCSCR